MLNFGEVYINLICKKNNLFLIEYINPLDTTLISILDNHVHLSSVQNPGFEHKEAVPLDSRDRSSVQNPG